MPLDPVEAAIVFTIIAGPPLLGTGIGLWITSRLRRGQKELDDAERISVTLVTGHAPTCGLVRGERCGCGSVPPDFAGDDESDDTGGPDHAA